MRRNPGIRLRLRGLRSDRGQSLLMLLLMLPVMLMMAGIVIDGGAAFAKKRQVQNAADAAALAAVQDLAPVLACTTDICREGYRPVVKAAAEKYSQMNSGPATLGECAGAASTNCYTWPYKASWSKIEVRLKRTATGFFTQLLGFGVNFFQPAARAVAGLASSSETHCVFDPPVANPDQYLPDCVIPGSGETGTLTSSTASHCTFDPPVVNPDQYLPDCVIPGPAAVYGTLTPGTSAHCTFSPSVSNPDQYLTTDPPCTIPAVAGPGNFAYTANTTCSSLSITHGDENFVGSGLWSNGGVSTSGAANTAAEVRTVSGGCYTQSSWKNASGNALPATIVPQRANGLGVGIITAQANSTHVTVDVRSGFAAGQTVYIGPSGATATISAVTNGAGTTATLTLSSAVATYPLGAIVTNVDYPLSLPNVSPWPCTSGNITIDSAWVGAHAAGSYCYAGTITIKASFTGYAFITSGSDIKVTDNGLTFVAPGADPKSNLLLYAVHGDIVLTPGGGVSSTGRMFAPQGLINYNGGSNVESGFMMSQTIKINNGPTNFVGSGPGGTGTPAVSGTFVAGTSSHCTFSPSVSNPDQYLPDCVIPGGGAVTGTIVPGANAHCVFDPPVANPDQYLPDCVIPGDDPVVGNDVTSVLAGDASMDE